MQPYIDVKKIYDDFIAVYSRVSTKGQDIKKQKLYAEAFLKGIDKDKIIWIDDENVSANKVTMDNRPGFNELCQLIRQGKVKKLIVYKRDRLARNFYEYVRFVKLLYKYKVEVIFTSMREPPFCKKLSIESLYGIFAQVEGGNISSRNQELKKQYPNALFGFDIAGKGRSRKYVPSIEFIETIHSLFKEISKVKSADELFEVILNSKRLLNNRNVINILNVLSNPFYSGHIETSIGYQELKHVIPIITLEMYKTTQEVLLTLKDDINNTITKFESRSIVEPICCECGQPMSHRKGSLGDSGYYVCSKGHKRVKIDVKELDCLIKEFVYNIANHFDEEGYKKDCNSFLKKQEKTLNKRKQYLIDEIQKIHEDICLNYTPKDNDNRNVKNKFKKVESIENDLMQLELDISKVEEGKSNILELLSILKSRINKQLEQYDVYFLSQMFFEKIEVHREGGAIFYVSFAKYLKGGVVCE